MPTKAAHFDALMRPHMERLFRLAWRLTGTRTEAEDLFQELLVRAYEQIDKVASVEKPGSWLARVMYNLFIDQQRRFRRERLATVGEDGLPPDGFDAIAGDLDPQVDQQRYEHMKALDAALSQLADEQRIIVLMHDTEGYKINEISEITGSPAGTIKSRLSRARARLKEILLADGTFSE